METMENKLNKPNPAPADGCLDWNATLTKDEPDYFIPPEGDYLFQVIDFERNRHRGSPKLPPCNKMTVYMELQTPEGPCRVRTDLFLHISTEWKIAAFFRAIGLKKRGEDLVMDWTRAAGKWGRCHVRPFTYTGNDSKEHTIADVSDFIDYDPELVKPPCLDVTGQVDDLPY